MLLFPPDAAAHKQQHFYKKFTRFTAQESKCEVSSGSTVPHESVSFGGKQTVCLYSSHASSEDTDKHAASSESFG